MVADSPEVFEGEATGMDSTTPGRNEQRDEQSGPAVALSITDSVALITLTAPERANALTLADAEGLLAAVRSAGDNPDVSCIVLASEGPVFCAGAHRSVLAALKGDDGPRILSEFYSVFQAIVECPVPTIAAVEGSAVGAGLNLALACDIMVAARGARLDARFAKIGLHPGGGHSWLLRRVLGRSQAMAVGLAIDVLDGERAYGLGVAARLVADGLARETALDLAHELSRTRRQLLMRTKATLSNVPESYADARAAEMAEQLWSLGVSAATPEDGAA
jgi:enoyl-CoA hydratase